MVVLWPALIVSIRMTVFQLDLMWIQFSQSNQFDFILMYKKVKCAHNLCVCRLIFHQFFPCNYTNILLISLNLSSVVGNWFVFRYIMWAKQHNLYLPFFIRFSWRGPTFSLAGYWLIQYYIWVSDTKLILFSILTLRNKEIFSNVQLYKNFA